LISSFADIRAYPPLFLASYFTPDFYIFFHIIEVLNIMIKDNCGNGCGEWRNNGGLFDNEHIKDYPQMHYITTDEGVDAVVLRTGMVTSHSQLKRLYKQGAVRVETLNDVLVGIKIGQRRLIYGEP